MIPWFAPCAKALRPRSIVSASAGDARRDLLEQLEPFATDYKFELHESGRVAVRPRQIRDQAAADRIGDLDENNRHGAGDLLQRLHAGAANGDDHVGDERDQFPRVFPVLACIAGAPTILDADVGIIGPAQLLQPLLERRDVKARLRIVRHPVHQHADAANSLRLLGARRKRPGGRGGESGDELAASERCSARSYSVMRGLDPRIHLFAKKDGLPGQARQ